MNEVQFIKHRIFRETDAVVFYDISVEESNAADLVIHEGSATSPPDDCVGAKSFYIHSFQDDYNRVVQGSRTFELVNLQWKYPYHLVNLFDCNIICAVHLVSFILICSKCLSNLRLLLPYLIYFSR